MAKITVEKTEIAVMAINNDDYISLTDMLNVEEGGFFVANWLRNRNTLEYIEIWEQIHNPNFNYVEFDIIKSNAGLNSFRVSAKELIEKCGAISLVAKTGRYGGTYAHKDIAQSFGLCNCSSLRELREFAFHFAMWISPRFQLLLVKEFQRLKDEEAKHIGWSAKRELASMKMLRIFAMRGINYMPASAGGIVNYHIHTDAIKEHLIPAELTAKQASMIYADEADVLNMALFGMTAGDWRKKNADKKGNIRDYASINELICLSNMENINAVLINDGITQHDRLLKLNKIAIQQMSILAGIDGRRVLK